MIVTYQYMGQNTYGEQLFYFCIKKNQKKSGCIKIIRKYCYEYYFIVS